MFNFGRNWAAYSRQALDPPRLAAAQASLAQLLDAEDLTGRSFLDVGFGSGLFSICASRLGAAPVVGIDVDPECLVVAQANATRYALTTTPRLLVASILDEEAMADLGTFDVVYAWGSLHHTGAMGQAISAAARRVAPGGLLAMAIYNQHGTSPLWWHVKRFYNRAPAPVQMAMVAAFVPVIYLAKLVVTRRNPLHKERGMSFAHDVVDWVGGFPYEYAPADAIVRQVEALGFQTHKVVPASVPTGCNEFVFARASTEDAWQS